MNFKYPIQYLNETKKLNETVKEDLELVKANDDTVKPIYDHYINPKTELGKITLEEMSNYYTTNVDFLKNTQNVIENIDKVDTDNDVIKTTYDSWKKIKSEEYFIEKYQYIGWEKLKWLNNSTLFLQLLSVYNIFSPVINLVSPLIVFIVPFLMLKTLRVKINWQMYKKILIMQLKNHAIGRLFTSFGSVKMSQKIYILFCAGMYVYNLYQNIISCIRYYKNSFYILENINNLKKYLRHTIKRINTFTDNVEKLEKYSEFSKDLKNEKKKLEFFLNEIENLPTKTLSMKNLLMLGKTMKSFYKIYDCIDLNETMEYSFKFNGYIECLQGVKNNINEGKVKIVKFKKKTNCKFKKMYHPSIENPVKNNIDLSKNKIITGPNASGKTTILKTLLINVILSQQYGYGYFDSGVLNPYHHIHCYLNIPDTSGRDSLFQAEARRCKEILDLIEENPDNRHICIFDELYSGTNPYEAVSSAYGFLKYIKKNKNVNFLLTTHFIRLCKLLEKEKNVENCRMKSTIDNYKPKYYYVLEKEISKIKGGIAVLKEIEYPEEILNHAKEILEKI